jgi:hypothetical protein
MQFSENPNDRLSFSNDTVQFDTVFTTIGSITKQFRFYNRNHNAIKTNIELAGGKQSFFRINIDGESTKKVDNYEIMPNDSAFIFIEVNIDPQNKNNPIIIEDSIMFYTNGNQQNVKLVAYGQDVHLYNDSVIDTRTWLADKPYLIYNSVWVKKNATLTIEEGAQIHFHNKSVMWVEGTLKAQGSVNKRIVFQSDRSDGVYENAPGQWYEKIKTEYGDYFIAGIHFLPKSINNLINYAIIKNGVKGIQVDSLAENSNPKLILSNSIIKNMSSNGILAQNSTLIVYNSVIANCKDHAVYLSIGGDYEFYHSTIGNYYPFDKRDESSLRLDNYYIPDKKPIEFPLKALFGNCIIYGDLENEVEIYQSNIEGKPFSYLFDHCLMKLYKDFNTSDDQIYRNIIRDKDSLPNFIDPSGGNLRLDTLSAAIDRGSVIYSNIFRVDQDGNDRTTGVPDLGAYERIQGE